MSAETTARPFPPSGSGWSNTTAPFACHRCHDEVGSTGEARLTHVRAADGRTVMLAEHVGECPPSRRCPSCWLIDDHARNCPAIVATTPGDVL